jgi:hypothetical protein
MKVMRQGWHKGTSLPRHKAVRISVQEWCRNKDKDANHYVIEIAT